MPSIHNSLLRAPREYLEVPYVIFWQRLVPCAKLDLWSEQLAWIGEHRLIITEIPARKTARIDIYCENSAEAKKIKKLHGGKIKIIQQSSWIASQQRRFCMPVPPALCIASEKKYIPQKYKKLIPIIIPAGPAFGTGEHDTTSMCLRQLICHCERRVVGRSNLPREKGKQKLRTLDVGTGSGILALAAAALGHRVTAIDNDPFCIRESKNNALRNPHIPSVAWRLCGLEKFSPQKMRFDCILANLYAECLIASMPRFKKMLKPQGILILSGILKHQASSVIKSLRSQKIRLLKKLSQGKWVCLVARV